MTFHKGRSGNPAGRPRGARNKRLIVFPNDRPSVCSPSERANTMEMQGWTAPPK
jgi:hypothetical protein